MDDLDIKIINILLEDGRATVKDIASKVNLSSPTVSERITRLKKKKIIQGVHAQVDPFFFNYQIKAFISIALPSGMKEEFYEVVNAKINVIECDRITGEYNTLLIVLFDSTEELNSFIEELQKYGKTNTQIAYAVSIPNRTAPVRGRRESAT